LLKNQEESNITNLGKALQIISQNETHTSIVMLCDNWVIKKKGDIFSIEGPYKLNCNTEFTCYSTTITDYFSYCGWCKYWRRTIITYITSNYITLDRCF
jgi:hypothetical protein